MEEKKSFFFFRSRENLRAFLDHILVYVDVQYIQKKKMKILLCRGKTEFINSNLILLVDEPEMEITCGRSKRRTKKIVPMIYRENFYIPRKKNA